MDAAGWDSRYATDELIWTAEPNRWLVETLGELPPGIVPIWARARTQREVARPTRGR